MTTTQTLEDGVRYVPGLCVTFPQGAKIDISRFKDVREVWIADVSRRIFDNPRLSRRKINSKQFCIFSGGGLFGDNYRLDMEEEIEGKDTSFKPRMLTLVEAVEDCYRWHNQADTIDGGGGIILHVPTGQLLQWRKYFRQGEVKNPSFVSKVKEEFEYLMSKLQ